MPDVLDALRAADPAVPPAARAALDGRAQAELQALLADGDQLAARRTSPGHASPGHASPGRASRGRPSQARTSSGLTSTNPVPRRWGAPAAAAAAAAVLLAGTFGGAQIAALRGDDPSPRSALANPGVPGASADAAAQRRLQAALDQFRAAKAKATPPYLCGAFPGHNRFAAQLRLDATHDPAIAEAVRAGNVLPVSTEPSWEGAWEAFRAGGAGSDHTASAPAVAPAAQSPTEVTVTVPTATGPVELAGYDLVMGRPGSGVHLLIPAVPATAYVDLPAQEAGARPVFLPRYERGATQLTPQIIEDENATRGEYALDVREEDDVVVLGVRTIRDSRPANDASAGIMRRTRTVDLPAVTLKAPLGGRPVVDAATKSFVTLLADAQTRSDAG